MTKIAVPKGVRVQSFPKGVHPHDHKEQTKDKQIVVMKAPDMLYVPVFQHIGAPAEIKVQAGDKVKKGQLIAEAKGFVSANIFSPVSGEVKGIVNRPGAATARPEPHIQIENDRHNTEENLPVLTNPSREQILNRLREAGIVGMGGAAFPTHVKMQPPKEKVVDTLMINAAECEPFITCDYRIMIEYAEEFLEGVLLLAKALGVENINVGLEANKADIYEMLAQKGAEKNPQIKVTLLKKKYPQGAEKQLIYAIDKRKVPAGGLPADVGVVVSNVHTALSTYEAVVKGKPLYERIMTVTGHGINEPKNFWCATGTTYEEVAKFCGEATEDTIKVISGGPMMGFAQPNLEACTAKNASALLFLTAAETDTTEVTQCINCGKCHTACPMNLMPMFIDACTIAGDYEGAKKYGAQNCMECGCCVYICPANRQIVSNVRIAKKIIRERKI